MSTRCCVHFMTSRDGALGEKPAAMVYRHTDGYPEEAGVDLRRFIRATGELNDPRWSDPEYLAAKYVVWLARQFQRGDNPLNFFSVGVTMIDADDLAYLYLVRCGADGPQLSCFHAYTWKEEAIPELPAGGE